MDLYEHPVNKFVAGFIGSPQMNFYDITIDGKQVSFPDGSRMQLPNEMAEKLCKHENQFVLGIRGEDIKFDSLMKIHIIGCSGSGKTYLANALSKKYNISHFDLDDIQWDNNAKEYGKKRRHIS